MEMNSKIKEKAGSIRIRLKSKKEQAFYLWKKDLSEQL